MLVNERFVEAYADDIRMQDYSDLNVNLEGIANWDYVHKEDTFNSIYELAKRKVWNANVTIDWDVTKDRSDYPMTRESNPLSGYAPYESLSRKEKIKIAWLQHALEISEILHGEQGALIVSSQLVTSMPTIDRKLFSSTQVFDEARHVEFFNRYLKEFCGEIHKPTNQLRDFLVRIINESSWEMKFIGCQIIIESLAMAKFSELKSNTNVPTLETGLDYILKDEARHVKFGTEVLKEYLLKLSQEELDSKANFVLDNVLSLSNSQNIYTRIAERMGWNVSELRMHLRSKRVNNKEQNSKRFRQLILALSSVGLLTEKLKARLLNLNLLTAEEL